MNLIAGLIVSIITISIPCLIHYFLIKLVTYLWNLKHSTAKEFSNIQEEQSILHKLMSSLGLLSLSLLGVSQVLRYYLFSGAYFWFIIFSWGLLLSIYIAPLGAVFAPFINKTKNESSKLKKIVWNFISTYTWVWGIILLIDREALIFSDESGSHYTQGSATLKFCGGISLILVGMYLLRVFPTRYKNVRNIK